MELSTAHKAGTNSHKTVQVLIYINLFFCLFLVCLFFDIYCKIPKISPGAYIFQRPFLRGLFLEGLIFGGAYLREICVSKSIRLALYLERNLPFLLSCTFHLRANFQLQAPGGLIFGGTYTWKGLFSEFYGIITCYA